MSPMSLVNLPASSLRHAHDLEAASPCGERSERRLVCWVLGGLAASVLLTVIVCTIA